MSLSSLSCLQHFQHICSRGLRESFTSRSFSSHFFLHVSQLFLLSLQCHHGHPLFVHCWTKFSSLFLHWFVSCAFKRRLLLILPLCVPLLSSMSIFMPSTSSDSLLPSSISFSFSIAHSKCLLLSPTNSFVNLGKIVAIGIEWDWHFIIICVMMCEWTFARLDYQYLQYR